MGMEKARRGRFLRALRGIVGQEAVLDSPAELILYEFDASLERATPEVVVLPRNSQQVADIVALANREAVPYVARGAGTGLSGGSIPVAGGMVISMARFNRILEIDLESRTATVEPGVVNLDLNNALARRGYWFAPDPASWKASTIGGNAAENAGGPHCLKYGVTSNHVLGLEVVLPTGQVAWTGGQAPDFPGYDLTGLLVGSEGTLGIFTRLIVGISPRPHALRTMLAVFEKMEAASQAVSAIIAAGILPATLEMMDSLIVRAVEDFFHVGYPQDAGAVLIIEVDGLQEGLDTQVRRISEICRDQGAREVRIAQSEEERQNLWTGRREFLNAITAISPGHITADGTVPRNRLPEVLGRVVEVGQRYGLSIGNVFHAGDGNLHPIILVDPENQGEKERAFQACHDIMRICVEAGGTISGEHGIGMEKTQAMPLLFAPADLAVMESIKNCFDPAGLCNPGKIFPSEGRGSRVKGVESRVESRGSSHVGAALGGRPGRGRAAAMVGAVALAPMHLSGAAAHLGKALAPGSYSTGESLLDAYRLNGWRPSIVLSPSSPEEAAAALGAAAEAGIAVLPWGSGTKMGRGLAPNKAGAVLGTRKMTGVVDFNPENLTVTVRAGTILAAVQETVGAAGQMVSLDPAHADRATIGGILSANASGPRRFRYGAPRDLVLGLQAALPDGRIIRAGGRTVKNVAGYDLTRLFIGSLGTLGLITEATLKLRPVPEEQRTLVLPCRDLAQAGECLRRIMASSDLLPAALELLSDGAAAMASERVGLSRERGPVLVVALEGFAEEVEGQASRLASLAPSMVMEDPAPLWRLLADGLAGGLVARAGVPAGLVTRFMEGVDSVADGLGVDCPAIAEAGTGIVRLFPRADAESEASLGGFLKKARSIAAGLGGYLALEEAPAQVKAAVDVWGDPGPAYPAMERLKAVFDPLGILSPGRFVGGL